MALLGGSDHGLIGLRAGPQANGTVATYGWWPLIPASGRMLQVGYMNPRLSRFGGVSFFDHGESATGPAGSLWGTYIGSGGHGLPVNLSPTGLGSSYIKALRLSEVNGMMYETTILLVKQDFEELEIKDPYTEMVKLV